MRRLALDARYSSIRTVLSLASLFGWSFYQIENMHDGDAFIISQKS